MRLCLYILLSIFFSHSLSAQEFNKNIITRGSAPSNNVILKNIISAQALRNINVDSGIAMLQAALKQSQENVFEYGIAKALIGLAEAYRSKGLNEQSILTYKQSLPYCYKSHFDKSLVPHAYIGLANAYIGQDNYEAGVDLLYKAAQLLLQNNKEFSSVGGYLAFSVGFLWQRMQYYDYSLPFFNEALKIAERNRDTTILIGAIINIGNALEKEGNIQKATIQYLKAISIARKNCNITYEQIATVHLATLYMMTSQNSLAQYYNRKAIKLSLTSKNYKYNIEEAYSLARAYYNVQDFKSSKALVYETMEKVKQSKNYNNMEAGISILANIYYKEKNYKEAAKWLQSKLNFRDRYSDRKSIGSIDRLEYQYRIAQKDKDIATNKLLLANKEIKIKNRNIGIAIISACGVVLSITLLSLYRIYKHIQQIQNEKIRNLEQEQEIGQLKAMLKGEEKERIRLGRELHDGIVGQLSAVKLNLTLIQKQYSALSTTINLNEIINDLDEAAKDLRKTAHNLMPELLLHNGLSGAVHMFCEKINRSFNLKIYFHLDGHLPPLNTDFELSIYRTIQELINNVIKHAKANEVLVQISCHEPVLLITIEDNGIGMTNDLLKQQNGIGLSNIKERIALLKGKLSMQQRNEGGTAVDIEFDIANMKKT